MSRVALIIPTYNAGKKFPLLLESLSTQDINIDYKLIVDSGSVDDTLMYAEKYGFDILKIYKQDFNHGLTRDKAVKYILTQNIKVDFVIFITQDILFASTNSISNLMRIFKDKNIAAAYGRQLVGKDSSFLEHSTRKFNYSNRSMIKTIDDIPKLGIYTIFLSNSFAAYRISEYLMLRGFPKTNFGEDMLIAAKFILTGRHIAYVAEAEIIHSHKYSIYSEYDRGREIAKMHLTNKWILKRFGSAESRGNSLVRSVKFYQIPILIIQALPKYVGYKITKLIGINTDPKYDKL